MRRGNKVDEEELTFLRDPVEIEQDARLGSEDEDALSTTALFVGEWSC